MRRNWMTDICPFCGARTTSSLERKRQNYCSESQRAHKIQQWEARVGQNHAAILVLEQLYTRRANLFEWFYMPLYKIHNMSEVGDSDRLGAMNLIIFNTWAALLSDIQPQHLNLSNRPGGLREALWIELVESFGSFGNQRTNYILKTLQWLQ